jgi:hypothetical protein
VAGGREIKKTVILNRAAGHFLTNKKIVPFSPTKLSGIARNSRNGSNAREKMFGLRPHGTLNHGHAGPDVCARQDESDTQHCHPYVQASQQQEQFGLGTRISRDLLPSFGLFGNRIFGDQGITQPAPTPVVQAHRMGYSPRGPGDVLLST